MPVKTGANALPPYLTERVVFQEHDMFEPQPVTGADVYLLRHILHDWPDHYASRIISQLVPALKPGARLLISDMTLPPPHKFGGMYGRTMR